MNIAKIGAGGKQGPVSLDLPLINVIKRGNQVDINILDAAAESLKLVVIIEKRSRLFVVQDLLIAFPECNFAFCRKRSAEFIDNGVEFAAPEC